MIKYCRNSFLKSKVLIFIVMVKLLLISKASNNVNILQKISDVNVLLPYCESKNCKAVNYKITAFNGCYNWKFSNNISNISNNNIENLRIIPVKSSLNTENSNCNNEIIISSKVKLENNNMPEEYVWIQSVDLYSNKVFSCKVGFSRISNLKITKRFDVINVNEIIELDLQAFDINNNVFSSLEGYTFKWIVNTEYNDDILHAEINKLNDGNKFVSKYRLESENVSSNLYSDIVLIKGLKPGIIYIEATLIDFNSKISTKKRKLNIVEPFTTTTNEIYILPNYEFEFILYNKYASVIDLKSNNNYNFSVNNKECGYFTNNIFYTKEINNDNFVKENVQCVTEYIIEDIRTPNYNKIKGLIYIVIPNKLEVALKELSIESYTYIKNNNYRNLDDIIENDVVNNFEYRQVFSSKSTWKLIEERFYASKQIVSYNDNEIVFDNKNLAEYNFKLNDVNYSNKFIKTFNCYGKSRYCIIKTIDSNFINISSFNYIELENSVSLKLNNNILNDNYFKSTFYNKIQILIYPKLQIAKFNQKFFVLPFLGNINSQELSLNLSGGSGAFAYNLSNDNLILSNNRLYANNIGKTKVTVYDPEVTGNKDSVEIIVEEPGEFIFESDKIESFVNQTFSLGVVGISKNGHKFTNCTSIDITDYTIKNNNETHLGKINFELEQFLFNNNNYDTSDINIEENIIIINTSNNNMDKNNKDSYFLYSNGFTCIKQNYKINLPMEISAYFQYKYFDESYSIISKKSLIRVYDNIEVIKPSFDSLTNTFNNNIAKIHLINNLSLMYNSSINLLFKGGPLKWHDETITNQIIFEDQTLENKNLDIVKNSNNINQNEFLLSCKEATLDDFGKTIVVKYISSNIKSKTLKNPVIQEYKLVIYCGLPKFLSFIFPDYNYLNDKYNNKTEQQKANSITNNNNKYFDVPQKEGIDYYFERSKLIKARIYLFDYNKNLMIVSDINKLNKHKWESKIDNNIILNSNFSNYYFVEHMIDLSKSTNNSKSILSETILKINSSIILNNSAHLNLINFPTLEEKKVILSSWSKYEFFIKNGSGDFEVKTIVRHNQLTNNINKNCYNSKITPDILIYKNKNKINNSSNNENFNYILSIKPNNNSVLCIEYLELDIYIIDKKISDFYIELSIIMSGVKDVVLSDSGLLMQGNTKLINIHINGYVKDISILMDNGYLNYYFNDNDISYSYMYTTFTYDSNIEIINYLKDNPENNNKLSYLIKGTNNGKCLIHAKLNYNYLNDLDSLSITTNEIEVYVFEKISIYPKKLLMMPKSIFSLNINNYPTNSNNIYTSYAVENRNVASVSSNNPLIYSKDIGITKLNIKVIEKKANLTNNKLIDEDVIFNEDVEIEVSYPDKVIILLGENRKIFNNSSIRLVTMFKKDGKIFNYSKGDATFEWYSQNEDILKISKESKGVNSFQYYDSLNNVCNNFDDNEGIPIGTYKSIGIFVKSLSKGESIVSVDVSFSNSELSNTINKLTAYQKIVVDDSLFVSIPEYLNVNSNKSGLYMLPYNINHKIKTNKTDNNIKFVMLNNNNNIASLTVDGNITTYSQSGISQILITQIDKNKTKYEIPVVLSLFVTEFYSIFINQSYRLMYIDEGDELQLDIILQHKYGLIFANYLAGLSFLKIMSSNNQLISAEIAEKSNRLNIKALSKGLCYLILYNKDNDKIYDVATVEIHAKLNLINDIIINKGSNIIMLDNEKERKNKLLSYSIWDSKEPEIVSISSDGYATCLKEGNTVIELLSNSKKNDVNKIKTNIKVLSIKAIVIDDFNYDFNNFKSKERYSYLTNYKLSEIKEFKIRLNFKLTNNNNLINNYSNTSYNFDYTKSDKLNSYIYNIDYDCDIEQSLENIISAKSYVNYNTSEYSSDINNNEYGYFCIITVKPEKLSNKILNNVILSVTLKEHANHEKISSNFSKNIITKSEFNIPFFSSFSVFPKNIDISENKKSFEIILNSNLDFIDCYVQRKNNLLDISEQNIFAINYTNNKEKHLINFRILQNIKDFKDIKIVFKHKITEQEEFININNDSFDSSNENGRGFLFLSEATITNLITIIVIIATSYIIYNHYFNNSNENSNSNTSSNNNYSNESKKNKLNSNSLIIDNKLNNPYSNFKFNNPTRGIVNDHKFKMSITNNN